ncbi:MAG: hypothetical protein K6B70_02820 [Clostridia bacterium]|nr:hypothetical protein [Clostridia bacterium]
MRITELPAYKRLEENFKQKGYSKGIEDKTPIYCWDDVHSIPPDITVGHYAYAHSHGKIKFRDIPEKYRTREFFLHELSGAHENVVDYVKTHLSQFDKQFFKDHIATDYYALEFELNDFEIMPLDFIDEEMVACAMFKSISMRYVERRGDCDEWFYSVYRRKPEVLTQELYILGARCFAAKNDGKNKFLYITPKEFRTPEYYFALCLENRTPVMEDIPREILTDDFIIKLINDKPENIRCFDEETMERKIPMAGNGTVKIWQVAIILDGYQIRDIPLNDERVKFFLSKYDKDSWEYRSGFKNHYKEYIREKESKSEPKNYATELASMTTLIAAVSGMDIDSAIDLGSKAMKSATDRQTMLPISYRYSVPAEYAKQYDTEEYLLEIYKKLGIKVVQEVDSYYYSVILPKDISVVPGDYGYCIKNSNDETLIHYYDRGSFYDRDVEVDEINVTL